MWEELGISGGTALIVLAALYFVIRAAVKSGIKQAYRDITGQETRDDAQWKKTLSTLAGEDKPKDSE